MVKEVLGLLDLSRPSTIVDCTLGGGGHAQAILAALPAGGRLLGIDQDEDALKAAAKALHDYDNLTLIKGNFGQLGDLLDEVKGKVDGFLFDLGVSSWQLDNPARGFSYQGDSPLDMRMNQENGICAYDIVNNWSVRELTRVFRQYGEERWSSRVAEFIAEARKAKPLATSCELVEVIKAAIPAGARRGGGHPGRRIFQALRIAVNSELENLRLGLESAAGISAPGGVIIAISYHSLEDRIVKQFFRGKGAGQGDGYLPAAGEDSKPSMRVLTKKPLRPSPEELNSNPRSRSAKLRAATKLGSNERLG